jgi:hypothetical protein
MQKRVGALFALAALCIPVQTNAQVLYGSVVGNVTDPSHAAVPSATVTITNKQTNLSRETLTNDTGGYSFPSVPAGTYDVKVSREGFATFTQSNVQVTINNVTRIDAVMKVGNVAETVTITAESALLQTERAEVRAEVSHRQLTNLPVPTGRNYQNLFRTLPGIRPPDNQHSVPTNPSRALAFNVNGASRSINNTRLDGASSTNIWLPHIVAYVPTLESIETVNVVTNSFDAEQGLAGGAAINVQIRSGTNDLHGSLFEYHTNQHLKAKPFFLPQGQGKPKLVYNEFGGTLGGPIKRDRLFYFMSYEGTLDRQNASRTVSIPTPEMKRGDLSGTPPDRPIYDPNTGDSQGLNRTPFAGNIIPSNRLHPISQKILGLMPDPNLPGISNNYFVSLPYLFDRHRADTKVNWNVSSKLNTFARFSILHYDMNNPEIFGQAGGQEVSGAGGNPGTATGRTYSLTLAGNYIVTPTLIVDANFGYTTMGTVVEQPRLDENIGLDFLGIPGTNGTRRFEGGWPRFSISNFANMGINNDFMPYDRSDPQFQYVANFNWTKGTHEVRFGFDFYRQHMNHLQPEVSGGGNGGASGAFTFGGGPTQLRNGPSGNAYNSMGTFLLGLPTSLGKITQVPDIYRTRASLYSLYVRDRWNINRRLSLSYGVRWEYFPFPTRDDRGMEWYDPTNNTMQICGVGQVPEDCGVNESMKKFAPRIGLAYRATDTWVIRAGYGLTNDPFSLARPFRTNYPVLIIQNIAGENSFVPVSRLEQGIPRVVIPDFGNGIIPVPGTYTAFTVDKNYKRGYVQSWNFTIQKQIAASLSAEAGYVATRSTNQMGYFDLNAGQRIGAGNAGQPLRQQFGRTAPTQQVTSLGTTQYDSLQAQLNKRFSQGMQFGVAYTWSKVIGYVDNNDSEPSVRYLPAFERNRVVRGYDRTHNFQATHIWELPFGKGRQYLNDGVGSAILGGWQLNNILSLMSGTPFTVSSSGTSLDLPGSSQTADQILPEVKKLGGVGRGQSYFDPFAFAPVTEPRFGTSGLNTLRGPGIVNWDIGVFREFAFTERVRLRFQMEAFNFSNTPHFANPGANRSNLVLNPDGSIRDRAGFTEITGVTNLGRDGIDERQFRFGLRLSF